MLDLPYNTLYILIPSINHPFTVNVLGDLALEELSATIVGITSLRVSGLRDYIIAILIVTYVYFTC